MDSSFLIALLIAMVLCGAIGFSIGNSKGLGSFGAMLGALLGPIGLVVLALLPPERSRDEINEPDPAFYPRGSSYAAVTDEDALVPRAVVKPRVAAAPAPPRFYICAVGGDVRGPYNSSEIAGLRADGSVDETTLFCLEGSQKWTTAPKIAR